MSVPALVWLWGTVFPFRLETVSPGICEFQNLLSLRCLCTGDLAVTEKFLDDSERLYGDPHPTRYCVRNSRRIVVKVSSCSSTLSTLQIILCVNIAGLFPGCSCYHLHCVMLHQVFRGRQAGAIRDDVEWAAMVSRQLETAQRWRCNAGGNSSGDKAGQAASSGAPGRSCGADRGACLQGPPSHSGKQECTALPVPFTPPEAL